MCVLFQERLKQEKAKNARIEKEVQSFEERKGYLEQIGHLKVKAAWIVGDFLYSWNVTIKIELKYMFLV